MSFSLDQGTVPPGTEIKLWDRPLLHMGPINIGPVDLTLPEYFEVVRRALAAGPSAIQIGPVTLSPDDFVFCTQYVMTNTDLSEDDPDDPREEFQTQAKALPTSRWPELRDVVTNLVLGEGYNGPNTRRFMTAAEAELPPLSTVLGTSKEEPCES